MYRTIEKINKKTHRERQRIALLGASLVTGVLIFVWGVTLPARLNSNQNIVAAEAVVNIVVENDSSPSPFKSIANSFKSIRNFNNIENSASAVVGVENLNNVEKRLSDNINEPNEEIMPVKPVEVKADNVSDYNTSSTLPFLPEENDLLFLP